MEMIYRKDEAKVFDKLWSHSLKENDIPWSHIFKMRVFPHAIIGRYFDKKV